MVDVTPYLGTEDNWTDSGRSALSAETSNRITDIQSASLLSRTGVASVAKGLAADYDADAIRAGGQSRASQMMSGAIGDAVGSVASAGIGAYGRANNLGTYAKPDYSIDSFYGSLADRYYQ